jgi:hypothetical protein
LRSTPEGLTSRPRLLIPRLMSPLRGTGLLRILACFATVLFLSDLIADSVAEVCEKRCAAESSQSAPEHDKGPCQCICAAHIGAVIASDFAISIGFDVHLSGVLPDENQGRPPRLAASIDHPPQLS